MSDVCFATVEEFAGCIIGCRNAAAVLGGSWATIPRRGELPDVVVQADLVILSSWDERYDAVLAERRGPTVVRWHSTVLQTELAQEQWQVVRIVELLDRGVITAIAVCDPEYAPVLGRPGIVCLPDVLDQREYRDVSPLRLGGINVSLFGAGHWRKNLLVQAAAFDRVRRRAEPSNWTLHLNGQSLGDGGYGEWLQAAKIPFVDHGRLERPAYLSLLAAMDAGLCATLSESYCYVAADHVALGVPVVASPTIACLGAGLPRARPEDVDDVADALACTLADGAVLAARQRLSLDERARANAETARAAVSLLLARARSPLPPQESSRRATRSAADNPADST